MAIGISGLLTNSTVYMKLDICITFVQPPLNPPPLYWPVISSPFIYEPPFSPAIWSVFGKANAWEWSKQAVQTNSHESVKFSFTYVHVSAMKNKPMALRSQDILLDGSSCKRTLPEKFSMPHTKFMFACFASFLSRPACYKPVAMNCFQTQCVTCLRMLILGLQQNPHHTY